MIYNYYKQNIQSSGSYNIESLDNNFKKFIAAIQKIIVYIKKLRDLREQNKDNKLKSKLSISKEDKIIKLKYTFLITIYTLSAIVIQIYNSIGRIEKVSTKEELNIDELFDALSNIYTNIKKFFVIIKSISPLNTNSNREDDDNDEVINLTSSNDNKIEKQKKRQTLIIAYNFGGHKLFKYTIQFLHFSEELAIILQNIRKVEVQ